MSLTKDQEFKVKLPDVNTAINCPYCDKRIITINGIMEIKCKHNFATNRPTDGKIICIDCGITIEEYLP